jgi:putative hydrolase of HD superfamily
LKTAANGPFSREMVLKLFEAFSIERWNDLIRPFEVVEMDKAAQTAVLAYVLGKLEEDRGNAVDWDRVIYALFFDLLRKIALSDIKSPVQRMLRTEYPHEYAKLNGWIVEGYAALLGQGPLLDALSAYLQSADENRDTTWRIMRAAHKYSAIRELEMIARVNEPFRVEPISRQLAAELAEFADLAGVSEIYGHGKLYQFITKIEQLRFQTRWNQTPRVPRTSVLGHSFFVATMVLLMGESLKFCPARRYNNFFSALFHDLPEAVTRDIISPVKQATDHLSAIVKRIEDRVVEKELLPLMHDCYRDELVFFTANEFENRIIDNTGHTAFVSFDDLQGPYNDVRFKPVDGRLIRAADHIAAFVEADSSISYGITSVHLRDGRNKILSLYPDPTVINGHDIGSFFASFSRDG